MNYYRIKSNLLSPKWAYAERAQGGFNYSPDEKEAFCVLKYAKYSKFSKEIVKKD